MNSAKNNCCDFAGDYALSGLPLIKKLEQAALGSNYGATSWTTRQQVDAIIESLALHSGSRLLDIGSGSGWPGLLLGKLSRCDVTLLDTPRNALQQAAERAGEDQMTGQVDIVQGSATSLPFLDGSFDRISHSDVLCCLQEKMELLQESRRVARDDARMHFSVILPADDLPQSEYDEVLLSGPPFVSLDSNYADLLRESGWQVTECLDVTADYSDSLLRLVAGIYANESDLVQLLGSDDVTERRQHREAQIGLINRSLMRRETYAATAI